MGSIHYAAPEQFRHGRWRDDRRHAPTCTRSGLVLYELACGVSTLLPRRRRSEGGPCAASCNETPRPLGEVNPQLSAFFEEVVHCAAWPRSHSHRFAVANELLEHPRRSRAKVETPGGGRRVRHRDPRGRRTTPAPSHPHPARDGGLRPREPSSNSLRALFEATKRRRRGSGAPRRGGGRHREEPARGRARRLISSRADGEDLNFLWGSYRAEAAPRRRRAPGLDRLSRTISERMRVAPATF